ncbi:MAG: NAD(P)H-dependent oxidoreductase, partial [Campylobacter sp.]|nr:NAD(P)H-dependent oxidoreductase [Campylobacter sp.]
YGSSGKALNDKKFGICMSFGGKEHEYSKEYVGYSVNEILVPFECTIKFIGAKLVKPFFVFDAQNISDKELNQKAQAYKDYLKA